MDECNFRVLNGLTIMDYEPKTGGIFNLYIVTFAQNKFGKICFYLEAFLRKQLFPKSLVGYLLSHI